MAAQPFRIKKEQARNRIFIVIGAAVAVASLVLLVVNLGSYDAAPWLVWGPVVGLVAGSLCFALFIKRMPDDPYALVIDEDGIWDHASQLDAGLIPWDDIKGVYDLRVRLGHYLVIDLKDPEGFAERHPIMRSAIESRQRQGLPVLEIAVASFPGNYTVDEALDAVRQHPKKLVKGPKKFKSEKKGLGQVVPV